MYYMACTNLPSAKLFFRYIAKFLSYEFFVGNFVIAMMKVMLILYSY